MIVDAVAICFSSYFQTLLSSFSPAVRMLGPLKVFCLQNELLGRLDWLKEAPTSTTTDAQERARLGLSVGSGSHLH